MDSAQLSEQQKLEKPKVRRKPMSKKASKIPKDPTLDQGAWNQPKRAFKNIPLI